MAEDERELIVRLEAEIGDATAKLDAVGDKIAGLSSTADGSGKAITKSFAGIGLVAGTAVVAISALVRKAWTMGSAFVKAYTDADAAARQFYNTLETRGLSAQKAMATGAAIDKLGIASGYTPEDLSQALANLTIKFSSGTQVSKGFQIALDNARAKGITLSTSIQQVTTAALGSLKALRQFGLTTNKDVNGNLMTTDQLLEEMARRVNGGLTTSINSAFGAMQSAAVAMQEMKESAGALVTQAFAPLATYATGAAQSMLAAFTAGTFLNGQFNDLTVSGAKLGKFMFNVAMTVRMATLAYEDLNIATRKWFTGQALLDIFKGKNPLEGEGAKWDKMLQDWTDGMAAADTKIKELENTTPEERAKAALKEIQQLIKGVTTTAVDGADTAGSKWQAAFQPLKLLSGNLPELTKYIGNLGSNFLFKSRLDIYTHDDGGSGDKGGNLTDDSNRRLRKAVRGVVNEAVQGSTVGSHGTVNFLPHVGMGVIPQLGG